MLGWRVKRRVKTFAGRDEGKPNTYCSIYISFYRKVLMFQATQIVVEKRTVDEGELEKRKGKAIKQCEYLLLLS